ncbi:LCP family protein [Paenibacillus thiaminolyticus]|uniref:LCP family protein n=1 Tax=Paenibacillus thiaminolyticus TaxID=49283 RepID=UPI0011646852|nr:LCP family protein [Paenibacillus thiaminolyticus]NGP62295.1 LCP family protein [Paenibacillus thiaminolyticus]
MNSSTPLPPRKQQSVKAAPARKGMPKWLKAILIAIIILSLGVISYAGYILLYANKQLDNISTAKAGGEGTSTVQATLTPKSEPFSFVLLGLDYRPELPGKRTDVIMVGAIHPDTQEAVLVSLPRDTYFNIPGYGPDKLNHFYPNFYVMKERGTLDSPTPEDEMRVMLGQYLGIDLDYTAVINFKGFVDLVDAVGGVDVNVDQDMCYVDKEDGTHINLSKGFQHLDGKNALDFVRYRKSNWRCSPQTPGTTDFDRNKRQNAVLKEIVNNMQSLGGLTKATDVIDALADNFTIDMLPSQIRSALTTYMMIDKDNIHYISVDGDWKSPYIYPFEDKLEEGKQALKDVLAGKSLKEPAVPEDTTDPAETPAAPAA